jgi:hypothetical protein
MLETDLKAKLNELSGEEFLWEMWNIPVQNFNY